MLTTSHHIIAIKKLNNIMINYFQNPHTSVFPNKWRFNSSQDWETLALEFGVFSIDDLVDETFQPLSFHISAIEYLEEDFPRFTDVTDLKLTAKTAVMNNPGQVVIKSEEKMVKNKNKRAAKRKERIAKLCAPIASSLFSYLESSFFLSPRFVFLLMPALMPASMPTPLFYLRSSVVLLSGYILA